MKKSPKKSKKDRISSNLSKVIRQYMSGRSFVPVTMEDLMQRLSIHEEHRELANEALRDLVDEGCATLANGQYSWKQTKDEMVIGTIRMHPRGFGFVKPNPGTRFLEDIFIPKPLAQNAVDGDVVEVQVNSIVNEKGPEGKVVAILERGRTHIAGTVYKIDQLGEIIAYAPILGSSQRLVVEPQAGDAAIKIGDRVVMEIIDWGGSESETTCRITHYIGHISDPSCDIAAAIEEFNLHGDFPSKAVREAESFGKQVSQAEIARREDLRGLECITIDPDTAKDFDDAVNLTVDKKGHFHLGVHIADVSHYVTQGSALDHEALIRSNSTYFPGFCLPMLPAALSDNLCSLKPAVNRLAVSTLMEFDPDGNLLEYKIVRSVIKSLKRFTYREALAVLEGRKKSPHEEALKNMVTLCNMLKEQRYKRGSLDLALPELVIIVDEKGAPTHTDLVEYDITHQLVEEFMLKTNETIARHLDEAGKNLAYRVHDSPGDESLQDFVMLARAFGFDLKDKPDPEALQNLFNEAVTTSYGQYLSASYIRRMRMAFYSPDNIGHYGLSLTHYCHFTSPIRRYADLIVHRILFGDSDEYEVLKGVTARCSDQERLSAKAENNVNRLKKLRLLTEMKQQEPNRQFEAVITDVKPFGIAIEVIGYMLDSFIHVSELGDDFYNFEERKRRLCGSHTGATLSIGDELTVTIRDIDLITIECRWEPVLDDPIPSSARAGAKKPKRDEKRKRRQRRR